MKALFMVVALLSGSIALGLATPQLGAGRDTSNSPANCGCGDIAPHSRLSRVQPGQDEHSDEPTSDTKRPVYRWEFNLYSFLVNAFSTQEIDRDRALRLASGILDRTRTEHVTDPKQFLQYAFHAMGMERDAAIAAAEDSLIKIERKIGVVRPLAGKSRAADDAVPQPPIRTPGISAQRPLNKRPYYNWKVSGLHEFVYQAFHAAGIERAVARKHADWVEAGMSVSHADWKDRKPEEILSHAFRLIGRTDTEASGLAYLALYSLNVRGYAMSPKGSSEASAALCPAYPVRIIWCEDSEQQVSTGWIKRNSWDNLLLACPSTEECPSGQSYWWTLTVAASCTGLPEQFECVWIGGAGDLDDVECGKTFDNDCFSETISGINCANIEKVCGDDEFGPSGCPGC